MADSSEGSQQTRPGSLMPGLRQRAEEVMRQQPEALREIPAEDIQNLIHELGVHQIELEMQNDELRRAQQELTESRDRFLDLYDFAPVGYLTLDETGLIRQANLTLATMLGVARGQLIKQPLTRFVFSEDQDTYYHHRRQFLETKEPQDYALRLVKQDGALFWTRVEAVVDQDGEGQGHCRAIVSDISVRKQAEEALRKSEQEYRDLVEKISDVIYAVDTRGIMTYVSPAVESFLGFTPQQLVGRPFARFIVPEDLERSKDTFQDLMSGVSPGPSEYRTLNSSGETRWMRVSSQPIVDGDQITGIQGVLTDITERKRVEEQLEEAAAAAERQRLARELHDTVTQVLYAASLVAETLPAVWDRRPQAARKGLEQLRDCIKRAQAELRTMLLELRPDTLAGKQLDELIRQLADGLMARTRTSVTTTVVGDCSLPAEVNLALYRIAQEALNNVSKHAQAGQVNVHLTCEPRRITLEISDDGWGFDPDDIEPGQLGVGIMYERAKAIGGELILESQVGKGTTVTVFWQDATGPGQDPHESRKRGHQ